MRYLPLLLAALAALVIFRMIGPLLKSVQQAMGPPAPADPNTVDMVKCPSCGSIFAPGQAHSHAKK